MARFNPNTYDPVRDNEGHDVKKLTKTDRALVIVTGAGICACGCGTEPAGKKSLFAQGHDARLRGKLTRAHVTATPVFEVTEGKAKRTDALTLASRHLNMAENIQAAADRLQEKAENRRKRATEKAAKASTPKAGDPVEAKIGRWTYEGQFVEQDGDKITVRYEAKNGDTKMTKVAAKNVTFK